MYAARISSPQATGHTSQNSLRPNPHCLEIPVTGADVDGRGSPVPGRDVDVTNGDGQKPTVNHGWDGGDDGKSLAARLSPTALVHLGMVDVPIHHMDHGIHDSRDQKVGRPGRQRSLPPLQIRTNDLRRAD